MAPHPEGLAVADFPLKVLMSAVDRVSGPIGQLHSRLMGLVRPIMAAQQRLKMAADQSGLTRIVQQARKVGSSLGDAGRQVGALITKLGVLGAVGGGIAARLVNRWASAGDEIAKTARKLGVSMETLQELRFAGSREGLETSVLDKGIEALRRSMGQAALGSGGGAAAFNTLGVSVLDAEGRVRSFESVFDELAAKLSKLDDSSLSNTLASMLFGGSGTEMMKLLSQGTEAIAAHRAEAHRLGLVMSKEAITTAERFVEVLKDLLATLTGLRNALAAPIAEHILPMLQRFREWLVKHRPEVDRWAKLLAQRLPEAFAKLRASGASLWKQLSPLLAFAKRVVDRFGPVTTVLVALGAVVGGPLIASVAALGVALAGLGLNILALPFGVFLGKIALLAVALAGAALLIKEHWKPLSEFFSEKLGEIRSHFQGFLDWADSQGLNLFDRLEELGTPQGLLSQVAQKVLKLTGPSNLLGRAEPQGATGAGGPERVGDSAWMDEIRKVYGARGGGPVDPARSQAAPQEARVRISFDGVPPGVRVRTERNDGVQLDLDVGRAMLGAT